MGEWKTLTVVEWHPLILVVAAWDVGMRQRDDEEHLLLATAQGRVLYGFNVGDFYRLHTEFLTQGRSHAGIIFIHPLFYPNWFLCFEATVEADRPPGFTSVELVLPTNGFATAWFGPLAALTKECKISGKNGSRRSKFFRTRPPGTAECRRRTLRPDHRRALTWPLTDHRIAPCGRPMVIGGAFEMLGQISMASLSKNEVELI